MADLVIKVSEGKYEETLQKLQQQLNRLKDLKGQLESQKGTLSEGLQETLGRQASEMIDANLRNVNTSIEKVQSAIDQIQGYLGRMTETESDLNSTISSAADEARKLFD